MTELLAIYGTLKVPLAPYQVSHDTVRGRMYSVHDAYPALVLDEAAGPVEVSIHRIPYWFLPRLDQYEGLEHGLYNRARINTNLGPAWIYLYNKDVSQLQRISHWR